jgi:hypothetical protein
MVDADVYVLCTKHCMCQTLLHCGLLLGFEGGKSLCDQGLQAGKILFEWLDGVVTSGGGKGRALLFREICCDRRECFLSFDKLVARAGRGRQSGRGLFSFLLAALIHSNVTLFRYSV